MNWTSMTRPIDGRPITGKCHRCGWTAELTWVDRHLRTLLEFDRRVRLLCDDCRNDVVAALRDPRPDRLGADRHPGRGRTDRSVA